MKKVLESLSVECARVSSRALPVVLACACVLNAAGSDVPNAWNVAPMRSGAYLEGFESTMPAWGSATGASVLTDDFPAMSGLPARSNLWFDANTQVMELDTAGTILTNLLQHTEAPTAIDFENEPVYVDMRVRFNAMSDDPDPAVLADCKLAVFVSEDAKLVVVHGNGISTNATVLDTNLWYQVSVKMEAGQADVKLNDSIVFSGLTLQSAGTENVLAAVSFKGTGYLDELYVSHGAPDYPVPGPTTAIPALPADGSNMPTDEQQTRINKYLSDQAGLTDLNMTQDDLSAAYLVNAALTGEADPVAVAFGISAIEIITPTSLQITAKLTVDSTDKDGGINGRIQLFGKVNKGDGWTLLDGAVSPGSVVFSSGEVTFTYAIPAGGYKFFKGQIIP